MIFRYISEPQLGIQIEANYIQKGWSENRDTLGNYRRQIDMLEFPFLTHFYIGKYSKFRYQIELGPYMSYLLKESETLGISDTSVYRDYYGKAVSEKFEFGYIAGISVGLRTHIGIFELQGIYSHSLINLFKPGREEFVYIGSRAQAIVISINYLIRL